MRMLSYLSKTVSLAAFGLLFLLSPTMSQGIDFKGIVDGIADEMIRHETRDQEPQESQSPDQPDPEQQENSREERSPPQTTPPAPAQQENPRAERPPAQTVDIRSIQQNLAQLGYSPGVADGLMGPKTKNAIRQFQRDQGLDVNGVASPQLLENLRSVEAPQPGPAVAESTARPSFDCARASTPREFASCGNTVLKGEDAYTALLRRYIQAHDEVEDERAFLLNFAGLGCRAQEWERQSLNPFDRQDITAAAASRLAAIRSGPAPNEPLIFEYTYRLTLEDYDLASHGFPLAGTGGASLDSMRPNDFCRTLARDAGEIRTETFPFNFFPAVGGEPLEPQNLPDLLGGFIAQDQASARALYEMRGFPTVEVRLVGQAGTPMLAGSQNRSLVPFTPLFAEIRLQGAREGERALAVFQAKDFNLPNVSTSGTNEGDGLPRLLTDLDVTEFFLLEHEEMLNDPAVASVYAYSVLEPVTSIKQLASRPERCVPVARLNDHQYNEFDIQELLDAAPQRALQRLNERSIPETFSWQMEGKLGTYDASRGGFPVEDAISRRRDWNEFIILPVVTHRGLTDCLRQRAGLRTPAARARDNGLLNFVPMAPGAADRLVSAAPDRAVSITMALRPQDASRLNGQSVVTFTIDQAEVVAEATGETLLKVRGDDIDAANNDTDELWAGVTALEGTDLLLEAVRRDTGKINHEDYVNRWIQSAFCRDIQQNRDNPIRLARLFKDKSDAFATALHEQNPLGPKSIRMSWVKLGDYDLEKETFPLIGHSLDGERPLGGFQMQCPGVEAQDGSAPASYEVTVNGLADIAQTGLPMSIDEADAYIESQGGRRNRWERINFFVIIDDVRFGTVDASGVQQVQADAVGYRIADLSGDEILHEASFRDPSETGSVEE